MEGPRQNPETPRNHQADGYDVAVIDIVAMSDCGGFHDLACCACEGWPANRSSFTVAAAHLRVASAFQRDATVGILRLHS
jgi:hypothetical protein